MLGAQTKGESGGRRVVAGRGFTLIELLVVVSIIALLITIAVPAISGARRGAKNVKTRATIKNLSEGLEAFRVDNEKAFRHTNGYPPSARAEDPATPGTQDLMGAQWLVRHLMGKDLNGYIPRRIVPPAILNDNVAPSESEVRWYSPKTGDPSFDRIPAYVSLDRLVIKDRVGQISPFPPNRSFWDWRLSDNGTPGVVTDDTISPVAVDAVGYPILYYAANAYGKALCVRKSGDRYNNQQGLYTHQDNEGFTGRLGSLEGVLKADDPIGWRMSGKLHPLAVFGPDDLNDLDSPDWSSSFANYIHDHRVDEQSGDRIKKPFRADSYLLITTGADGVYGTDDDITNFER